MGLNELLTRGEDIKPPASVAPMMPPSIGWGPFFREFLRVEFDKILLFTLAIYLFHSGQIEYGKYVIYGLAVAINHNRFKWN